MESGGVFSPLASALVAWLQVRQHEELAQSYAVAALELGFIEEQAAADLVATQDFSRLCRRRRKMLFLASIPLDRPPGP